MRGPQDAGGDTTEIVRLGPRAAPNRARALAGHVSERAPEGAEAPPSRAESDVGDRQIRVTEQRRRALDAPREQVAMRRHAERLLERSGEVGLGDVAHTSQAGDGPGLVGGRVHAVPGAEETAEEVGVLGGRAHW